MGGDKTHQLQHKPTQSHRVNTTRQQTTQTQTHALYKTTLHYRQVLTTPRITHRGLPTRRIPLQPLRLTQQIRRNIVCVPPIHHQRTPTRNVQRHPIQPCQVVPTARRQPKRHHKAPRRHPQVHLHPVKIVPMRRSVPPKRLLKTAAVGAKCSHAGIGKVSSASAVQVGSASPTARSGGARACNRGIRRCRLRLKRLAEGTTEKS